MEDFETLLATASATQAAKRPDKIRTLKTKLDPPRRESRRTGTQASVNVQRFLAKRSSEAAQKEDEAMQKKANLLELRNSDARSRRTAKVMLKRTKSSNKAAIEEAINLTDTAVTLAGVKQCDQDDYGYESQAADSFFEKIVSRFNSMPPKHSSCIQSAKLASSVATGASLPDKSSSLIAHGLSARHSSPISGPGDMQLKRKLTKAERIVEAARMRRMRSASATKSDQSNCNKNVIITDRPMSAADKLKFAEEEASRRRKLKQVAQGSPPDDGSSQSTCRIDKDVGEHSRPSAKSSTKVPTTNSHKSVPNSSISAKPQETTKQKASVPKKPRVEVGRQRSLPPPRHIPDDRAEYDSSDDYDDEDDEMDDFIDDSDAKMDISRQIRNIFGYDRRKFVDEEPFDDRAMENNKFGSLMQEEARSARIGKQEDLEDMRREEEEKRLKKKKRHRL